MKLTQRGKIVATIAYLLAIAGLILTINYLHHHTRITTCHNIPEGWACGTTWK